VIDSFCYAWTPAARGAVLSGARDVQLMMLSGFCLEMLEAAGKAPLDARTAIGRAMTLVSFEQSCRHCLHPSCRPSAYTSLMLHAGGLS
jgi:hypothetical protein